MQAKSACMGHPRMWYPTPTSSSRLLSATCARMYLQSLGRKGVTAAASGKRRSRESGPFQRRERTGHPKGKDRAPMKTEVELRKNKRRSARERRFYFNGSNLEGVDVAS